MDEDEDEEDEDEEDYHYVYEDEEADKEDEDDRKESSRMSESQDEDKALQEVKGLQPHVLSYSRSLSASLSVCINIYPPFQAPVQQAA